MLHEQILRDKIKQASQISNKISDIALNQSNNMFMLEMFMFCIIFSILYLGKGSK